MYMQDVPPETLLLFALFMNLLTNFESVFILLIEIRWHAVLFLNLDIISVGYLRRLSYEDKILVKSICETKL